MQDNNNKQPKRRFDFLFAIVMVLLVVGFIIFIVNMTKSHPEQITFTQFTNYVTETGDDKVKITGNVSAIPAGGENYGIFVITGTKSDGTEFTLHVTTENLNQIMTTSKYKSVTVTINTLESNIWLSILISLIPYIIMIALFVWLIRSSGGNSKAFDFAKSTARLNKAKTVTFNDVAGCDEEKEELIEIIDFLKNPRKYNEIGARIPKGVLLFGSPGTGKTLLAKAVAGEAGVPFFSISGSDFVEMFVGVGAARVRDMFKTAKENAPCIVFIDEIDAVGRQRGAGMGGGHDEREQTLNQLLVEMDGFSNNTGIIVMAATNRPDVLDPALLRPGRFDRQITISEPDVRGREAILKVHARNKHLDPSIKLDEVAQRAYGFSGADLENLLNEAALLAARQNRKVISIQDIDEAIDRVMMGPAKKSRTYTEKEKKMIAYHEAGHAVLGLKLEHSNIVQKITIIPRGRAGGYNLFIPKEETFTRSKNQLLDTITGFLGGRAAEEIVYNEISTGAHNDIQQATSIARAMVTEYGMSDLGPIQYEQNTGSVFLGRDYLKDKNFSDSVAAEIDAEVRKIIFNCHEKANKTIVENRDLLDKIVYYLLKLETITGPEIQEIEQTGHLKWFDDNEAEKAQRGELDTVTPSTEEKEDVKEFKPEDGIDNAQKTVDNLLNPENKDNE